MSGTATVESGDVVRLILQFCKENGLHRTLQTLQEETRVSLNTVDSLDQLTSDINHGRWDAVLQTMSYLSLPDSLLQDLYAHIVLEFIELHENELAQHMMREMGPCIAMKQDDPNRFIRLEQALKSSYFDPREAYEGGSKEKVRHNLAQQIVKNVQVAPPSRLLALVGQAMKWQQHTGLLPPDAKMDVFRGVALSAVEEEAEACPQVIAKTIKFGAKSHPECAAFSPDGQFMVSGSVDGFIECWDYHSGTLRKDLQYQDEGNFMMHDKAVIAAAFSKDSDLLATGSQDGVVKVWRIISGECVKKIERAHGEGITDISWSKDSTTLLTASFDHTARIQGLKSGKTLKEFRGHTSYVNGALFTKDNSKVITWSSDAKVKIFDAKTTECLKDINPPPPPHVSSEMSFSVNTCVLAPKTGVDGVEAQFYVCCRHNTIHLMNTNGQVLRSFSSGKKSSGDFVAMQVSPRGGWLYAVGEDHTLYSFSADSGKLEQMMMVAEKDVIGLQHHPKRNLMAAYSADGKLTILKP